ncbi:MAG: MATE family efflux transporter [Oscillospiraceae bacterium]|nr:MATE family efflux transporter [Oscillospiraceae bacterium]
MENPLGTERIGKLMLRYGIPATISMLVNAIYNMTDQIVVGNVIGMLGIAATNIAFPIMTVSAAITYLFGSGGAANFNLRLGEGNKEAANAAACNTLSLLALSGTIIGVVVLVFTHPLVYIFGATETVMPLSVTYTTIIAIGVPFGIFSAGACYIIRADGSPRYAMICTLAGAIFNMIADPVTAFVFHWGIAGVAWATTVGQMLTAAIAVYYFLRKTKTVSISASALRLKAYLAKRIASLGVAPCINQLGQAVVQITMNNTLRYYGASSSFGSDIPLGSVGAISKLSAMHMAVTIGIAMGCQPINGFNYGAGQYARVKKTLKLAIIAASIVSFAVFIAYQTAPHALMFIFGENDPLYLEFSARYLRIFMMMAFLSGVQPVVATFFPSIGNAKRGTWIAMSRQILFIMPLLLVLPLFFGLDGALYAGPIADICAASVSTFFVITEMKRF